MMNFFQRLQMFMQGRYGLDTLNKFLIGLSLVLYFVNIFVFDRLAHFIILLVIVAVYALLIFRALSRNINRRSAENRAFLKVYDPAKAWVKFNIRRFKDRENYRYRKCPTCKAVLRVKNKKGVHTVRCPKCNYEFKTKIR